MIAYLDCSGSGVSGDKLLGALIDAGADPVTLRERLGGLKLPGWSFLVEPVQTGGVAASRVIVRPDEHQPARHWRDIREMLHAADLPERARSLALSAFTLLAEAEAAVHGSAIDDVHFHEVGAVDSIIDMVGVALAVDLLDIEAIVCSPVAVGSGTIETEHGTLPVPAPATAELLRGVPTVPGDAPGELTTPTGAALVRALATAFEPQPAMVPLAVGYGAGSRDLPGVPNITRVTLGDRMIPAEEERPRDRDVAAYVAERNFTDEGETTEPVLRREDVAVLESNVDHVTPEHLACVLDTLMAEGALDAWQTPVVMKKGRLAAAVAVMVEPSRAEEFAARLIRLTGTLGVRHRVVERLVVQRDERVIDTSLGRVRVKVWEDASGRHARPEADECARIAAERDLSPAEVDRILRAEAEETLRPSTGGEVG